VVLSLITAVMTVLNRDLIEDAARKGAIDSAHKQGSTPPSSDVISAITTGILVFAIVLALITAIAFVTLAILDLRGNNVARIITWVVCGLFICCTGYSGISNATNAADLPGWYVGYSVVSVVLSLIIYIGVIVLLALPASNAYFKPKPQGQLY
jgi:hypothetical protein